MTNIQKKAEREREEIPSKVVVSLKKEKHSPKNPPKCETAGKWEQRKEKEKKSTQRKKEEKMD